MRSSSPWLTAGLVALATACTGTIGDPSGPGGRTGPDNGTDPPVDDGKPKPPPKTDDGTNPPPMPAVGAGRLRRLTQAQFENSLRDLLGAGVKADVTLPDSEGASDAILPSIYNTYAALTDAPI